MIVGIKPNLLHMFFVCCEATNLHAQTKKVTATNRHIHSANTMTITTLLLSRIQMSITIFAATV